MRLIDAAIKDLEMIGDCRTCGNKTPFCDSNPDSCDGYKWRGAPPSSTEDENPPLTLEELREMEGEPVYVRCLGGCGEWGLVETIYGYDCIEIRFRSGMTDVGGKYGLFSRGAEIFRRKPEEGMT